MNDAIEFRSFPLTEFRYHNGILTARIANYGVRSYPILTDGGVSFSETLAQGCFARALSAGDDIPAVVDHQPSQLLATTADGSLDLIEDRRGLLCKLRLRHDDLGQAAAVWTEQRKWTGCSFGMVGIDDSWDGLNRSIRSIAHLADVSLLRFTGPAYPRTTAQRGESYDWLAADRARAADELDRMRVAIKEKQLPPPAYCGTP